LLLDALAARSIVWRPWPKAVPECVRTVPNATLVDDRLSGQAKRAGRSRVALTRFKFLRFYKFGNTTVSIMSLTSAAVTPYLPEPYAVMVLGQRDVKIGSRAKLVHRLDKDLLRYVKLLEEAVPFYLAR